MTTDASMVYAMLVILRNGGLGEGVINFDAKLRRESTDLNDIFYALVGAMDAWALAAKVAQRILSEGLWEKIVDQQYAGWNRSVGQQIHEADMTFSKLNASAKMADTIPIDVASGQEEQILRIINTYTSEEVALSS